MEHAQYNCRSQELSLKLLYCESPFTWILPKVHQDQIDSFLINQLDNYKYIDGDTGEFKWRSFSNRLLLGFELWNKLGDIVSAKHHIDLCYKEMKMLTKAACSEHMFVSIHDALWHVTLVSRAQLFLENKDYRRAAKIIDRLKPLSTLYTKEWAGLYGIKSAIFSEYKPAGLKLALKYAMKARDMDPSEPEWHYMVAYCLGNIRTENDHVEQLEIDEIKEACALKSDPTYIVKLAQVYADCSHFQYHNRRKFSVCRNPQTGVEESMAYAKKAVQKFVEGVQLSPNCPGIKAQVAHGLLTIPYHIVTDASLAKTLLDEIVNVMPDNSMVHFDMGKYYEKYKLDPVKAMESLLKAHQLGNYSAFLYLIAVKWKYSISDHLFEDLNSALRRYKTHSQIAELLVYLGALHLLQEDDWITAVGCFVKSLQLDSTASSMEKFFGFYQKSKTNLLEVVTNELRIKTNQNQLKSKIYYVFLGMIIGINKKLFLKPPVHDLFAKFKALQMKNRFCFRSVPFSKK